MKRIIAFLLAAIMILSLAACGAKEETAAEKTEEAATEEEAPAETKQEEAAEEEKAAEGEEAAAAEHDNDLVIVTANDMITFNPLDNSDISNLNVVNMVYNRLFELDANLGGVPVLAEKVEYLSDTELTIKIYEGIKFHDGSDMTSEDVAFSLEQARGAATATTLMAPITSVEIVDDYTVKLTTDGIYPAITTAFTHMACSILPKEYYEEALASGDWSAPIGSGRYKLESRSIGEETVLVKNEEYWDPNGAAKNDSLTFKVIPEGSNRTIMVETGEADLNINFQTSDYTRATESDVMTLHSYPSATQYFVSMNFNDEYFSNPLVRQAVNYAIDKEAVLLAGYDGLGQVHHSYVAPGCLGFKDMSGVYSYDIEKAKELMAEAGYANGFTTDLVVWNDTLERVASVVQGYLAQIGITANIKRIEATARAEAVANGEMPMYVGTWGCYQDPDLFLARLFGRAGLGGNNWSEHESDEFEALYAEGRSTVDEASRAETYGKVQDYLVETAPWCPLFVSEMFALANKDLQGVEINVEAPYNFYNLHY